MGVKLLSVLGNGNYEKAIYEYNSNETEVIMECDETKYTQEAILNLISKLESIRDEQVVSEDVELYIYLTPEARKKHWEAEDGLENIVKKMGIKHKEFNISSGENHSEIMRNFETIYSSINEGDELYIDITHSFRSIPIIFLSVIEYAKAIKNIEFKGIFYGAYDRNRKEENHPIVDLSTYIKLNDWTNGIKKFLDTGRADDVSSLMHDAINPFIRSLESKKDKGKLGKVNNLNKKLKEFSKNLLAVRAKDVERLGREIKELLEIVRDYNVQDYNNMELSLYRNIFEDLEAMFSNFSDDYVKNINECVDICSKFGMEQQGTTLLSENITTYVFNKHLAFLRGKSDLTDIYNKEQRSVFDRWLSNDKLLVSSPDMNFEIESEFALDLKKIRVNISEIRNDMNHAGYNKESRKFEYIKEKLKDNLENFKQLIEDSEGKFIKRTEGNETERKLLLVFSHEITEQQIESAKNDLDVSIIDSLPLELQDKWSNIPLELNDSNELRAYLTDLMNFIVEKYSENDYILIQGDMGATLVLVNQLKAIKYQPIYSKTKRKAKEYEENGEKRTVHIFKHEGYRKY